MGWYPSHSAAVRLLDAALARDQAARPRGAAADRRLVGADAARRVPRRPDRPTSRSTRTSPDIRPYFERAGVFLYAPERGSGMKVKIQEAMAFGVPVVTTREGVEGLPAVDGEHAGISDDDAGLIDRTVALLRDPDRQNRQRHAARQLRGNPLRPGPTLDAIEAIYAAGMAIHGPEQRLRRESVAERSANRRTL